MLLLSDSWRWAGPGIPALRAHLIGGGREFIQMRLFLSSLLTLLPQGHHHWGLTLAGLSFLAGMAGAYNTLVVLFK